MMSYSEAELLHPYETSSDFMFGVYASHERKISTRSSFPSVEQLSDLEWSEDSSQTTNLRFVYWAHVAENAESLAVATHGSDVIAIESVAVAEADESESDIKLSYGIYKANINHLTGAQLTPQEEHIVKQFSAKKRDALSDEDTAKEYLSESETYGPLMCSLIGSGVRIEFLDLSPRHTHRYSKLKEKREQSFDAVIDMVYSGKGFEEIAGYALRVCAVNAEMLGSRDIIAANQISKLVDKNKGANMSIVYGSGHLMLTRMILSHEIAMQRVFVEDLSDKDTEADKHNHLKYAVEAVLRTDRRARIPIGYALPITADMIAMSVFEHEDELGLFLNTDSKEKVDAEYEIAALWKSEIPQDGSRKAKKELAKRIKQTRKIVKSVKS